MGKLSAGVAKQEITPPMGISMAGYFEDRKAEAVHDPLFARALVLNDGSTSIALVSCDLIAITKDMAGRIREEAEKKTGISGKNILVHATHIHTGPATTNIYSSHPDHSYMDTLIQKVSQVIEKAHSSMKRAKLGFGTGREEGIAFNRRYWMKSGKVVTNPGIGNPDIIKPAGPIDPEVGVLRIENSEGNLIAVLINYACHADTVGGNHISAGYPGYTCRVVEDVEGEGVIALFFNGASGDINHIDVHTPRRRKGFAQAKWMGTILGAEVLRLLPKIDVSEECDLEVKSKNVLLSRREITDEELKRSKKILSLNNEQLDKFIKQQKDFRVMKGMTRTMARVYSRAIMDLAQDKNKIRETEVQAIRVGNVAFVGEPCEFFVELGLEIKKKSPFKPTFIVELANDWVGYVPTPKAFKEGGYETRLGNASYLSPEAGPILVKTALELLRQLK